MDIGAKLKEARIAKDLSLDSLQETTKIQKRYLVAIEEGNFQILPGKFYARAFIKEYANAVGLDPNELLEEHKEEVPKTEEQEENEKIEYSRMERSRRDTKAKSSSLSSYFPTILTVLVVVVVLFVAWLFVQQVLSGNEASEDAATTEPDAPNEVIVSQSDDDDDDGEEDTDQNENDEEETDESDSSEAELSLIEEGTGDSPESTLELNQTGDELSILLETDDNTWLEITDDEGNAVYSGSFDAESSPEELDASGAEQLHFNIGNSPVLTITINGEEVEYPVDQVHQKLTIDIN